MVARSIFLLRLTKPGYATTTFLFGPISGTVNLTREEAVPPGMVPVPDDESDLGYPLNEAPVVKLDDFLIDRYEVTNEEYQKFVDAGGYREQKYWKQPFVREGRTLPWEESIALFRDSTGRPGPATWEVGAFPKGQEKHPVAGVSWFEAAAYAEFAGKSLPTAYHWTLAAQ